MQRLRKAKAKEGALIERGEGVEWEGLMGRRGVDTKLNRGKIILNIDFVWSTPSSPFLSV